jgi:hypothetical protein
LAHRFADRRCHPFRLALTSAWPFKHGKSRNS